jgi:hypothetical protein
MDELNNHLENDNIAGLDRLLETIGVTMEEFKAAAEKSPQAYINTVSRFINLVRRKVRGQKA